ncbi:MAG: glycoside hydrolase family 13 protein [Phycisphaerales bacterium]
MRSLPRHAVVLAAAFFVITPFGCRQPHAMTSPTPRDPSTRSLPHIDPDLDPARYAAREADWRVGPIVYQVFVDRYVPPANPEQQAKFFTAPRVFNRDWTKTPEPGTRVPELGCFSHELEFWGGDLAGVASKADYLASLGVDVLYLNPIHAAYTNHKYDAQDYAEVSPEYGTRDDVKSLARACRERGMKFMLDGVFNHMGRTAPRFQRALADPSSSDRSWFIFDPACKLGYRAWYNVPNLPEINLEDAEVRAHIWEAPDSVVRGYLRDGVDGWRLDVAYDIGPEMLSQITAAAHAERPGSAIIGEIWNAPEPWMPALDGLMNFHQRQILLDWFDAKINGARAADLLDLMVSDTGIEHILKCWTVLDNHDTARLDPRLPDPMVRKLARVLQFTLPGAPCVYYGSEVEMQGADDPRNRAPMRWDLVNDANPDLAFFKSLVKLRKDHRALRVGDWRRLSSQRLFAFLRFTDKWKDSVIVLANAEALPVREVIPVRDGRMMNFAPLKDLLSGTEVKVRTGLIEVEVPARTAMVLVPTEPAPPEYTPYKRVR